MDAGRGFKSSAHFLLLPSSVAWLNHALAPYLVAGCCAVNDKYKPQSTRSALCYLALAHPDQNFFYMWNKAENWANYTEFGFDIGSGSSFSLPVYYRMCEELVTEIKDDTELLECNAARMRKANVDIDDSYHTLAYDIIYCATTYHLYRDLPTYELKGVKNRISRANEREELDKLQQRVIEAEQKLNHINSTYFFPIELCGQAVHHPYFGDGIITNHQDYKLTVKFGVKETSFIYPDAITNKLLTLISSEIMERFRFAEELRADRVKREKALITARTNYEKKKSAFDSKWIKKIDNEAILEDDTL